MIVEEVEEGEQGTTWSGIFKAWVLMKRERRRMGERVCLGGEVSRGGDPLLLYYADLEKSREISA